MNPPPAAPDEESLDPFDSQLLAMERSGQWTDSEWEELAALEARAWVRLAARDQALAERAGHPLAPIVMEWRAELRRAGLEASAEPLDELAEELLAAEAAPVIAEAQGGGAEDQFRALMGVARSAREALLARERDLGPAPHGEEESDLRREFRAQLEVSPASGPVRDAWAAELVDLADETLAGSLSERPAIAVPALDHVRAVVLAHVAAVEPERGPRKRGLKRKLARLRDESVERRLEGRLVARFGERSTKLWASFVFGAILVLLLLMLKGLLPDAWLDAHPFRSKFSVGQGLDILDFACCLIILWDFSVRLIMVRGDWTWLRRHLFTDLLPSIPAGLPGIGEKARPLYIFRLGRLMRPLRAFTFLSRGLDRLVRLNAKRLDHELVLFPTPMERGLDDALQAGRDAEHEAWEDVQRAGEVWHVRLQDALPGTGEAIAERRLDVLREASRLRFEVGDSSRERRGRGYIFEPRLRRMAEVNSSELASEYGQETAERIARAARQLAGSPARFLPFLRAWTPLPAPEEEDGHLAARWLRGMARRGLRWQGRVLALADVSTTVSPAEFVGRVGATLMARTARPAYRLLLLGLVLLLVKVLVLLSRSNFLQDLFDDLYGLVGPVFLVLGSVCFLLLVTGMWLQRIARDASLLYSQIAGAQFAHLTDAFRIRRLKRDAELLEQRVLYPERRLLAEESDEQRAADRDNLEESIRGWLTAGRHPVCAADGFDPLPPVVLLYRDQLDAAPFTDADARSGARLLGNLSLRRLCQRSQGIGRREMKELARGDLSQRQGLLGGSYTWFQLMTQAMSQGAAKLVVEYNRSALPMQDLARATDAERERHRLWLAARAERRELEAGEDEAEILEPKELTSAFTMLHMLDDDPARDREVEQRFGPRIAEQLARDRRDLFVRVFGSWPLHSLPKEQRVLNPREFHERWLARGRIFLLPVWILWIWLRVFWAGLRFLGRAVNEIRNPSSGRMREAPVPDADAAARKLRRLRGPMAESAMQLRAMLDGEYLGLALPGVRGSGRDGASEDIAALAALGLPPELLESVEAQRTAARADVRRLDRLIGAGLLEDVAAEVDCAPRDPERLRAVAVAYRADLDGLRSGLSHEDILREALEDAGRTPAPRGWGLPRPGLYLAYRRWWRSVGGNRALRRHLWRLVRADEGGLRRALQAREANRKDPEGSARRVRQVLEDLLRHPGQITEPLVTLRTVQTLTRIDATTLREHVWRMAGFEDEDGRARTS